MPVITQSTRDLFDFRTGAVSKLLHPLRPTGRRVASNWLPGQYNGGRMLVAHDGKAVDGSYFRTFCCDIRCRYHEVWRPFRGGKDHFLYQAYLSVCLLDRITHALPEILCIHCDPEEDPSTAQSTYKRGPHLHVEKADSPVDKCHFPLNLCHLRKTLESHSSLTRALGAAIHVVRNEVVRRYE